MIWPAAEAGSHHAANADGNAACGDPPGRTGLCPPATLQKKSLTGVKINRKSLDAADELLGIHVTRKELSGHGFPVIPIRYG